MSGACFAAAARWRPARLAPMALPRLDEAFSNSPTGAPTRRGRVLLARSPRSGTACAGCDPFHTLYVVESLQCQFALSANPRGYHGKTPGQDAEDIQA